MANDLIVKDNRLIEAKYSLNKTQIKFIAFMASRIDKDDRNFFTYEIKLNTMLEVLEIERKNWKWLGRQLKELQTKLIAIQNDNKGMEYVALISYFNINTEGNTVEYRFDKTMKPFLLQLQKNFTKLSLEKILNFDSSYTIRLYEIIEQRAALLKKYKNEKIINFEIELDELKEMLVGEYNTKTDKIEIKKSYSLYGSFKQKVLDVAHAELKAKGNYYFEYEPVKTSRKITSIIFKIMTNKDKIKKDFKEKKKKNLLNGKEKQVALEQIRRIIERSKGIRDPLKYEQALFTKYLKGDLNYDKDLQQIKDSMDREELTNIIKQYKDITEAEEQDRKARVEKFKANLKNDKVEK